MPRGRRGDQLAGPARRPRPARGRPAPAASLRDEIGKRRPFDLPEQEAYLNLLRTTAVLGADAARLFRAHALTEATYNALRILRGHGPAGVPSQTIGAELVARVPDVTRLVDRLVEAGLAERARTEQDRRIVLVRITAAGLALLARLDEPVLEMHRRQLGHMSRADLQRLSQLLVQARRFGPGEEPGGRKSEKAGRGRRSAPPARLTPGTPGPSLPRSP